jgi:peptide/nickel transport system permease protein
VVLSREAVAVADVRPLRGGRPAVLVLRRLRRERTAVVSAVIFAGFALAALGAPVIARLYGDSPTATHQDLISVVDSMPIGLPGGVSAAHWLGIEPTTGRDLLLQLCYGARTSLGVAAGATVLSSGIGVLIGLVAGYAGGVVDAALGWLTDVVLAFPFFLFCIAAIPLLNLALAGAAAAPGPAERVATIIGVFGLFGWAGTARIVRGEVLALREREFVAAARAAGAGTVRILRSELLPNLWAPITVTASIAFPQFVTGEAALSFLNIGVVEPTPDWGRLLLAGVGYVQSDPLYMVFPGLAMFALVLAANLLADALRDALDPRALR